MDELEELLKESKYDKDKMDYLIQGFNKGFSIGYNGPQNRRDTSENLPLNNLGTTTDLWNKVMKEVKLNRYAGPYSFEDLPVKQNFIQSPIGLVPKAGGKTRLIFHLSYDFKNGTHRSMQIPLWIYVMSSIKIWIMPLMPASNSWRFMEEIQQFFTQKLTFSQHSI